MRSFGFSRLPSILKNCAYFFSSLAIRQDVNFGVVGTHAAPLRFVRAFSFFSKSFDVVHWIGSGAIFSAGWAKPVEMNPRNKRPAARPAADREQVEFAALRG